MFLKDEIDRFHTHINSVEQSIQFTLEKESSGKLPFLDVFVTRENDGSISRSVYIIYTHRQISTLHVHKSVVRTLFNLSSLVEKSAEEKRLYRALETNGYPRRFIQNKSRRRPPKPGMERAYIYVVCLRQ